MISSNARPVSALVAALQRTTLPSASKRATESLIASKVSRHSAAAADTRCSLACRSRRKSRVLRPSVIRRPISLKRSTSASVQMRACEHWCMPNTQGLPTRGWMACSI